MKRLLVAVALTAMAASGVAVAENGDGFTTGSCALGDAVAPGSSGTSLHVGEGQDFSTIAEAVAAAQEGDEIVIHPGIYSESVDIKTPGLLIRGTDRNAVILDGGATLINGLHALADRIVMENMTGRLYKGTAFRWSHQIGYWGRYLTAYNNEGYGIYAFDARCGQFEQSYASGNADAGYYIGECYPCSAVIFDVVAEENALGYSGTNAGGDLVIRDSIWRDNALGIVPNSLIGEARPPQRGTVIHNNIVEGSRADVPGVGFAGTYRGVGIVVAGGVGNEIWGNTVTGQEAAGILLVPLPEPESLNLWIPSGNIVWGNTSLGNGLADLAQGAGSGAANCWDDNTYETSAPAGIIETVWDCELTTTPPGGDPQIEVLLVEQTMNLTGGRNPGDWKTWDAPGPQESLTEALPVLPWLPALNGI